MTLSFYPNNSRKVLVMPLTARVAEKQIKILLTTTSRLSKKTSLWQMPITPPEHTDVYDGLMALSDSPETPRGLSQQPELTELVNGVIKGWNDPSQMAKLVNY
jgi:hypothetical protein